MEKATVKGIKKAVGDYARANVGGYYSARYGKLMLDRETGDVWTDEFYSFGHNEWIQYHDNAIINLIQWANENGIIVKKVSMKAVRNLAEITIAEYMDDKCYGHTER